MQAVNSPKVHCKNGRALHLANMFTAKDLEVYKDALKEKKNKPTKTGDKPSETPPSVAKISKPPLKLQNEEPIRERKPLSVVHKASNTIKDPHKPPSPIPVSTGKLTNPGLKPKTKEIKSRSPSPGLRTEANPLVKASSDIERRIPQSPRNTSLPNLSRNIKQDDNKISGGRKLKEPSTPKASNGAIPKASSFSGGKVAPAANVNPSLCSECTRSASEGAVCFIGNDGRVSACTTRSAVRLCKNLNCAANNPEYVAAMANAPKKYLISRRHSLKAQYGLKSKNGRSKSPNLEQTGSGSIDEWHHSGDTQNPLTNGIGLSNGGHADISSEDLGLECEDTLRHFDGDMSLLDGHDMFCDGEMGLASDVIRGTACGADYAAAEQGIDEGKDVINEQHELRFLEGTEGISVVNEQNELSPEEGKAGEIDSSRISFLESSTEQVEALAESNGDHATYSSGLGNAEELEDVDAHGSPILKASETGMAITNEQEDKLQSGEGEQLGGKAHKCNMDPMVGVCREEDDNPSGNVVSAIDNSQLPNDVVQEGSKFESTDIADDGQIAGETSIADSSQVADDIISVSIMGQRTQDDAKGDDPTPTDLGQGGDGGDSTSVIATNVAHEYQSGGSKSNEDHGDNHVKGSTKSIPNVDDGDNDVKGSTKLISNGRSVDDVCGYGGPELDNGDGDQVPIVNAALSDTVTSSDGKCIADNDQGDASTLLNDQHHTDDGRCDALTSPLGMMHVDDGNLIASPHRTQVADKGESLPSPQGEHVVNNEDDDEIELLNGKCSLEDCLSHDFMPTNDGHGPNGDESDEDDEDDEDGESDETVMNMCAADDRSPLDLEKILDSTEKSAGIKEEDGSSSSVKKGNKQRRRRLLTVAEEANSEKVTLRKQQMQERKQAEEWMANYAIDVEVHKLAPTREGKVKILVEAFEAISSHTDAGGIDTRNASKEKHTIA